MALGNVAIRNFMTAEHALERERDMFERVCSGVSAFEYDVWSTEKCLIAPRSVRRLAGFETACDASRARGWLVYLRDSGGDTVIQGRGVLNVSIAYISKAGEDITIRAAYMALVEPIVEELGTMGLQATIGSVAGSFCDGKYNVVVDGLKVAGTAQRWRPIANEPAQYAVFSHALILVDADLEGGVRSVNEFKRACGQIGSVRMDAHANLKDLGLGFSDPKMIAEFAYRLKRRHRARIRE